MNKTAFFTMDAECFNEISCLRKKPRREYDDFRIESAIDDYLELLDKYGIKATFFVLGSSLEHTKEYLLRAAGAGHEIALHGLTHDIPARMDIKEFKRQIAEGKTALERELKTKIIGYRAPCFAVTDEALDAVQELGFEYDSSYLDIKLKYCPASLKLDGFEKVCDGILKKDGFYEISPCKARTALGSMNISGGGYLRLAPYSMIEGSIKKFLKTHDYFVFYCHPADIFAGELPKLKGISPFQAYFVKAGRKSFLQRTENIIKLLQGNGYSFSTMGDFVRHEKILT